MTEIKNYPLAWPTGWPRTSIKDQKGNSHWKKGLDWYRAEVNDELSRMKAPRRILSTNASVTNAAGVLAESSAKAARDVGVAVYFERPVKEDFKWMNTLMLTGVPSDDDIDTAWRRLALPHHPDKGGDVALFQLYTEARDLGRKWARRRTEPPNLVIACDTFNEIRLNLCAIALSLKAIRQLERCGTSQLLERTFNSMMTLLTAEASR